MKLYSSILAFCFFMVSSAVYALSISSKDSVNVLVLNSYSYNNVWTRRINEAISNRLQGVTYIKLVTEFMDTKRYNFPEYYNMLFNQYKKKYAGVKFDAVVTSDDNAVNFALKYRGELFPGVPIVFCGVNNLDLLKKGDYHNISGIFEIPGVKETFEAILYLQPDLKKLYIINESSTSGTCNREYITKILSSFSDKFIPIWLEDRPEQELAGVLANLEQKTAVLLLSYYINRKQADSRVSSGAEFVCRNSVRPVYGIWNCLLGKGIIGGVFSSEEYQGKAAAEILLKILAEIPAEQIPPEKSAVNHLMFDYHSMCRFGVMPVDLPQNSIIINQPSWMQGEYRFHFFIAFAIIFLLLIVCMVLGFNIRARRRAEKALKSGESKFRAAFDSAKDSIIIWSRDYSCLYANKLSQKYLGMDEKEVIGKDFEEISNHLPAMMNGWKNRLDKAFDTGKAYTVHDEFDYDNSICYTETIVNPVKDEELNVTSVCLVSRDITERINGDKQRRELEERLQHSEKMKSIGYLAGGVAHDFNNILGSIIGAAEIIRINCTEDIKTVRFVDMIINSAERAADLTGKLLAFARKQKTPTSSIEINSLVLDAVELLRRTIYKTVTINYNCSQIPYWIIGDSSQLLNVILNLGINAEHAMGKGGTINISTSYRYLNEFYCEASQFKVQPGKFVVIEVSDTGCGISQENISKIFDPFFTTKGHGKGTGLGLATVYGTVQQHNGAIQVKSMEGVGTTFRIFLPLIEDDVRESIRKRDEAIRGSGNILVIDDDVSILETVAVMLSKLGYEVDTAENGEVAVNMFKTNPGKYDLVIIDMIMPVMNGRDCYYRLKELDSEVKIIISSGYAFGSDIDDMLQHGLLDCIQKPFGGAELSRLIVRHLSCNV